MISFNDITVTFHTGKDEFTAVKAVNFAVPEGGTVALLGPSGCGKSTLLQCAAGLITDFAGEIKIGGEAVSPKKHSIGFVPQNYGLLPWKTVEENIRLAWEVKCKNTPLDTNRLHDLMMRLGLETMAGRYPHELSGGQQQRASLARVFFLRPDILLLDEPFSALDAITREEMQDEFLKLWHQQAVTTVLVTHYVDEALYLGQKIIVLTKAPGRILKIIDNPLFDSKDARQNERFFALSLELRKYLQKGREL